MSDEFLNVLRRDPPAEFARRLKSRLHALDAPAATERRAPARAYRWLATAASVAALAFAFTLPAVRSAAEAFLDYFRVVNFAGVAFDPQRVEQLWSNASVDLPTLISGHVAISTPPSQPVAYASLDEAGAAALMQVRAPTWLPPGFKLTSVEVIAAHELRVTGDTAKLQEVLTALGMLFSIWARVSLGRNWSGRVVLKHGQELIFTGPYEPVTTQIYTGLLVALAGSALYEGRLRALLGLAFFAIGFWLKARSEEDLLEREFGDQYRSYRARTPMLIPSLRPAGHRTTAPTR